MLNVHPLTLGDYQTNTYIVHGANNTCVVIDPGYEPEAILGKIRELGLTLEAILLTHGHFDHVGGVETLVEKTGCRLWMSREDWDLPLNPLSSYLYPLAQWDLTPVHFAAQGQPIEEAGLTFSVLETPGHTRGSLCYRCGSVLFSGDTLFCGACGRTDLPGGDGAAMAASLARLAALEDDLRIFPGHGGATTLSHEKLYNPYL